MRQIPIAVVMALAACGGGQKNVNEGGSGGGGGETWDPAERNPCRNDAMCDPEILDEISHAFSRKQRQVEACYSKAVDSGKLSKKQGGTVAIEAKISTSGRATAVRVTEASTLKSDTMSECIIEMVKSWDLPKPNVEINFPFSYNFLAWE
jgi:hypothetical protein